MLRRPKLVTRFTQRVIAACLLLLVTVGCNHSSHRENVRVDYNNQRFVAEFDRTATGCAVVANAQRAASPKSLFNAAASSIAERRRQHARNLHYASAVLCMFEAIDTVLPLPPPETPRTSDSSSSDPATHLACVRQRDPVWVPTERVAVLAAARQWWDATVVRLAAAIPSDVDTSIEVWAELSSSAWVPAADDAWPVYSGTGQPGAWLTFDPAEQEFVVDAPSEKQVHEYCDSLLRDAEGD